MQVDEEAPIRANTTILLGNLSTHLSESTCKRVLLNAFTRALKDTFPPARIAGLKVHILPPEHIILARFLFDLLATTAHAQMTYGRQKHMLRWPSWRQNHILR